MPILRIVFALRGGGRFSDRVLGRGGGQFSDRVLGWVEVFLIGFREGRFSDHRK